MACAPHEQPATQIIVLVAADERVAQDVSLVKAKIYPTDAKDGDTPFQELPFHMSALRSHGRLEFPFSFGIVKGKSERFLLVIEGYTSDRTKVAIEQKAIVSFRPHHALLLKMYLSYDCYNLPDPCSGLNETCKDQICDPVEEEELEPLKPGDELNDASMLNADASATEPGDSAVDAGTEVDAAEPVSAMPIAGEPCQASEEGARDCDGTASRTVLECSTEGVWEAVDTCSETERCDPGPGPEQGTCVSCLNDIKGKVQRMCAGLD